MPILSRKERRRKKTMSEEDAMEPEKTTGDHPLTVECNDVVDVPSGEVGVNSDCNEPPETEHPIEQMMSENEESEKDKEAQVEEPMEQGDVAEPSEDRSLEDIFECTPRDEDDEIEATPSPPEKKKKVKRRKTHSNGCPKNPSRRLFGSSNKKKDVKKSKKRHQAKKQKHSKRDEFQTREINEQGVWVQCENKECRKWRFLSSVTDPANVDQQWICTRHPDDKFNSCDKPEEDYSLLEFIHSEFTEGSIIWAKIPGYPWWPAMVETDPDTGDYMEHDGIDSDVTRYHCIFLDQTVSRCWVKASSVTKFEAHGNAPGSLVLKRKDYSKMMVPARERAMDALKLPIKERIDTYGFSKTFRGVWSVTTDESNCPEGGDDLGIDDIDDDILGSMLSSEDLEELKNETEGMMSDAVEAVKEMTQKTTSQKGKDVAVKQGKKRKSAKEDHTKAKKKKHKKHKKQHQKSGEKAKKKQAEKKKQKEHLMKKMSSQIKSEGTMNSEDDNGEMCSIENEPGEAGDSSQSEERKNEKQEVRVTREKQQNEEKNKDFTKADTRGQKDDDGCCREGKDEENFLKESQEIDDKHISQGKDGDKIVMVEEDERGDEEESILESVEENEMKIEKDKAGGQVKGLEEKSKGLTKAEKEARCKEREEKKQMLLEEGEKKMKEREMKKLKKEQEIKGRDEKKKEKEMKKQAKIIEKELKKKQREEKKITKKKKKVSSEGDFTDAKKSSVKKINDKEQVDAHGDKPPTKKPKFSAPKIKPKCFIAPAEVASKKSKEEAEMNIDELSESKEGCVSSDEKALGMQTETLNEMPSEKTRYEKEAGSNENEKSSVVIPKMKKKKFNVKRKLITDECGERKEEPSRLEAKNENVSSINIKEDATVESKADVDKTRPSKKLNNCDFKIEKIDLGADKTGLNITDNDLAQEINDNVQKDKHFCDDNDDDFLDLEWSEAQIINPSPKKEHILSSKIDVDSDPFETLEE